MTRLIIDCDPGHDDAMAILYAARHLNLIALTTVFGNTSLQNTTRNALAICALAGLDIPVAAGMSEPLVAARSTAADIHGHGGLDGAALPEPTPVHEAAQLQADLRRAGIEPCAWIINQSLFGARTDDPLLQARGAREWPSIREVADRLSGRTFLLPRLAGEPVGPAGLAPLIGTDATLETAQ